MESVKTPPFTVGEHLGAHHDIDLTNLTAGNYVTLNGHWYGLEKADCRTSAYFHPKSPATGPTNIELTLVHCPWLGCPAVEPAPPALDPDDVRVDTFTAGSHRTIRVTHTPTGHVVTRDVGELGTIGTREALLAELASLVSATDTPALSPLRWHYGPTETDPYPGNMWCYDCGSRVMCGDGGFGCTGCGRESED